MACLLDNKFFMWGFGYGCWIKVRFREGRVVRDFEMRFECESLKCGLKELGD